MVAAEPELRWNKNILQAILDGQVASRLEANPFGADWRIEGLRTEEDHQGQGLARRLMEKLIADRGDRRMQLRIEPYANKPLDLQQLVDFYKSLGFIYQPGGFSAYRPATKQADYAPGLPSKKRLGRLGLLKPGIGQMVLQRHLARRAGPHYDLRLGMPGTDLLSWALPKGLPKPGERHLALRQPLHRREYAGFEGTIPEGYGAGKVTKADSGEILITRAAKDRISFVLGDRRSQERFTLVKTKAKDGHWLLVNTTPTETIAHRKVRYQKVPAEDVEQLFNRDTVGSEKIDGAAGFAQIKDGRIEILSYRTSKKGRPIVHTLRMRGRPIEVKVPPKMRGRILRGEIWGERKGKAIPAQELGALLNLNLIESLRRQEETKTRLRMALFDIKGDPRPYYKRLNDLRKMMEHMPKDIFHLPAMAETPKEKARLWRAIVAGKRPRTREGMVFQPRAGGRPAKAKLSPEAKVVIREILEGRGGLKGRGAGAFGYSLQPGGPIVGRVGTGFTAETRRRMWESPSEYLNRVARIRTFGQFPSGAHRAPRFLALHEAYKRPPKE